MTHKEFKMEIFIPKYNSMKLRGYVRVDLYHPEDIHQMEPIFHDEGENTVQNWLLGAIVDHIDATNSGATGYHLAASTGWHTDSHGAWDQGSGEHSQDGTRGMLVDANAAVPYGGSTQAFFMSESKSMSQPDAYTARWIAEGTWNGQNDSGNNTNTGTITDAKMGLNWDSATNGQSSTSTYSYSNPYASFSISSFTMQKDDKVKLTWDIAIDQ